MGAREEMSFHIEFALHPAGLISTRFTLSDASGKTIFSHTDSELAYNCGDHETTEEGYYLFEYKNSIILPPGSYRWHVTYEMTGPHQYEIHPAVISMSYYTVEKNTVAGNKKVGGIRIRRICNYDSDGSLADERTYSYTDASGRSTGMEGPQPFFVKHSIARYSDVGGDNGGAAIVTPFYAGIEEIGEENLCRYEGSAVQYASVTETRKSSSGSFLTEYRYRQHGFHPASVTCKTFHNRDILFPFTDNSYLDGLATSKTVCRTADGQHSVSVRERYGYDIIEPSPFVFRQKALSLQNIYSDGGSMEKAVDKYYYGTYELVSAMVLPTETRTVSYSPTGRDSVVAVNSQSYSRSYSHAMPVSSESYNSVSGCSHTDYTYCVDRPSDPIANRMRSLNMLSVPLESVVSYRGKTERTIRRYSLMSVSAGTSVVPSNLSKTCGGDSTSVTFDSHDSYGNPLSAIVNGTLQRFYLWSYNGKYPIAEISGGSVSYSDVSAAVKKVFGKSPQELSSCVLPDATILQSGGLQRELSGSTVTTFTFDGANGVATVTDTNGVVSSYAYDDFGRLLSAISPAVNASGSVEKAIKETYKYNYKH